MPRLIVMKISTLGENIMHADSKYDSKFPLRSIPGYEPNLYKSKLATQS